VYKYHAGLQTARSVHLTQRLRKSEGFKLRRAYRDVWTIVVYFIIWILYRFCRVKSLESAAGLQWKYQFLFLWERAHFAPLQSQNCLTNQYQILNDLLHRWDKKDSPIWLRSVLGERNTPMVVIKHSNWNKTNVSLLFVYLYNALKMHIGVLFHRPILYRLRFN